jgi:hypothetical protein
VPLAEEIAWAFGDVPAVEEHQDRWYGEHAEQPPPRYVRAAKAPGQRAEDHGGERCRYEDTQPPGSDVDHGYGGPAAARGDKLRHDRQPGVELPAQTEADEEPAQQQDSEIGREGADERANRVERKVVHVGDLAAEHVTGDTSDQRADGHPTEGQRGQQADIGLGQRPLLGQQRRSVADVVLLDRVKQRAERDQHDDPVVGTAHRDAIQCLAELAIQGGDRRT